MPASRLPARMLRVAAVLLLALLAAHPALAAQPRRALVIGNGAYEGSPLRNPVNDARGMAAALSRLGFEVLHLENADLAVMQDAVRAFSRRLAHGGVGLFYFAGHGVQSEGHNYLIPTRAALAREEDLPGKTLDAAWVLEQMEKAGNDLNLVILDACRNNPFGKRFRSGRAGGGLAPMEAPRGALIAFATSPGAVAADGVGENGVYTKHLLANLAAPGLPVEQLFKRVRAGVLEETANRQRPWETTSILGDFSFAREGEALPAPVAGPSGAFAAGPERGAAPVGVEFAMFRENPGRPATPVAPGEVMRSGEGYFFHIRPSQPCHLYLFQVDATGALFRLFPNPRYRTGGNPLAAGARVTLPAVGQAFYLDGTVGREEFYFVASQAALPRLETLEGGGVEGIVRAGVTLRGPAGVRAVTASPGEPGGVQELRFTGDMVHALSIEHR